MPWLAFIRALSVTHALALTPSHRPPSQSLEVTDALRDYAQKKIGNAVEQFARSDGVREVRWITVSLSAQSRAEMPRMNIAPMHGTRFERWSPSAALWGKQLTRRHFPAPCDRCQFV